MKVHTYIRYPTGSKSMEFLLNFRFLEITTLCFNDCLAYSWHAVDQLSQGFSRDTFPFLLEKLSEMRFTHDSFFADLPV